MIGIYKFTNKLTGKSYIGQSRDIHKRYIQHKCRHEKPLHGDMFVEDTYFHKMLKHYGFWNFDFEIIEECKVNELNEKEIYYIEKFNTLFPNGYNKDKGGNSSHPMKFDSYDTVEEVINLLKTSKLSNIELGKMYGVSDQTISDINNGRIWHSDNIEYPIRNGRSLNTQYYHCSCCGKEQKYSTKTGLCVDCYNKQKTNYIPQKEVLYDLLLNNTFEAVGKIYNVSSGAVRKWCDKYNIPRHSSYYRSVA